MSNDSKSNKKNVADYTTIKPVIYEYWYDYVETVTALESPKAQQRKGEQKKYLQQARNDLKGIYAHGLPSKNITESTAEDIWTVQSQIYSYQDQEKLIQDLNVLLKRIAEDMGEQGFLDTRMDTSMQEENTLVPKR